MTRKKKFETALKELEEIVTSLEKGDMPLEDALKSFEKGVGLARHCTSLLDEAEKRIRLLTEEGEEEFPANGQEPVKVTESLDNGEDSDIPF